MAYRSPVLEAVFITSLCLLLVRSDGDDYPSIEGKLTFMCLVEGTAPILLSVGLPSRILYAEGAFTTRYLIFSVREAVPSVNVVLNSMYPLTST